jgi:hypothetical protein
MNEANRYDYKYFSLLSGDDIVVKSIKTINDSFFSVDFDYISFQDLRTVPINPEYRVKYKYGDFNFRKDSYFSDNFLKSFERLSYKFGFKINPLFFNLPELYKGSQWFSIRRILIHFVLDFLQKNSSYSLAFKCSYCPDEIFFHTILANHKEFSDFFNHKTYSKCNNALRYIDWQSGPQYPKELLPNDFFYIKDSQCFFARKASPALSYKELVYAFGMH